MPDYLLNPPEVWWPFWLGRPVENACSPAPVFQPHLRGEGLLLAHQQAVPGVPGITTVNGEFPDSYKPQIRMNVVLPAGSIVYESMYHGVPGTSTGDDEWLDEIQPQLRLNTAVSTAHSTVSGRWKVNEVFLAP